MDLAFISSALSRSLAKILLVEIILKGLPDLLICPMNIFIMLLAFLKTKHNRPVVSVANLKPGQPLLTQAATSFGCDCKSCQLAVP